VLKEAERKMKISITCDWGGTIPMYELKRDVGLAEHIDAICRELKAPDAPANYALFNETNSTYIKPEVSLNGEFVDDHFGRDGEEGTLVVDLLIVLFFPNRITQNVTNVNFKLPDGTLVRLRLRPDLVAIDSIEKLTSSDPEAKRKALTQMKSRLTVRPTIIYSFICVF
jgi:hypothetical protein